MLFSFGSSLPEDIFTLLFREWKEEREGGKEVEREKDQYERDTSAGCLPHEPRPEAWSEPTTEVCALDWKFNPRPSSAWAGPLAWSWR